MTQFCVTIEQLNFFFSDLLITDSLLTVLTSASVVQFHMSNTLVETALRVVKADSNWVEQTQNRDSSSSTEIFQQ